MSLFGLFPVLYSSPPKRLQSGFPLASLYIWWGQSCLCLTFETLPSIMELIHLWKWVLTWNSLVFASFPEVSDKIAVCQQCLENDSSPNLFQFGNAYGKSTIWTTESTLISVIWWLPLRDFALCGFTSHLSTAETLLLYREKKWRNDLSLSRKLLSTGLQVKSWSGQLRSCWQVTFQLRVLHLRSCT